jgi:ArsR family transcriptional regulator
MPKTSKSTGELALVAQLKALGDQTRIELIKEVAQSPSTEACVCDLTPLTGLSQGTVSHHLKILVDAGLLNRAQRGKWAYYSLTPVAKNLVSALGLKITKRDSSPGC